MISLTSFIPEIKIHPNNKLVGTYFVSKIGADYQIGEQNIDGNYTIIGIYPNNKSKLLDITYSLADIKGHFKREDWVKIDKPGYMSEIKIQPNIQVTNIEQLYNFVVKNKALVVKTVLEKWNSEEDPDGQFNENSINEFIEEGKAYKSNITDQQGKFDVVKISNNTSVHFSTNITLNYEQEPDWINPINIKGINLYYFIEG